jgi:fatty-acid desaturase
MKDKPTQSRTRAWLVEPTYGYGDESPRKPTLHEVWIELVDSVAFWRDVSRLLPAVVAVYHLVVFAVFLLFLTRFFSLSRLVIVLIITNAIGIVYNTIWYHRYCSHRAFRFRSLWLARLFLWTNPLAFREESFAIPHRIHHSNSDQPGDPYGPHLGWIGSYLAGESSQKTNRDIDQQDYDRLSKSLEHIGFAKSSYQQFRRTGSVENVWHYGARALFASVLWIFAAYAIGGWVGVVMWMSAVFLFSFMLRDFNYRGHGGPFLSACKGAPINQLYYGITVGEWHENHHAHPQLARSGLAWWQLDIPYWIIRLLSVCGAVVHYNVSPTKVCQGVDQATPVQISVGP